ncbi:MAG: hypothetical protein KDB07_13375 [Planctomycetes bacterium]|nr:hypothetical protein [Planctomycetota bacterium]
MSSTINAALNEAVELLRVVGEEAGDEAQAILKDICKSITQLGDALIRGKISRVEAELAIENLIRAGESEALLALVVRERKLKDGAIKIAGNLLAGLAAAV